MPRLRGKGDGDVMSDSRPSNEKLSECVEWLIDVANDSSPYESQRLMLAAVSLGEQRQQIERLKRELALAKSSAKVDLDMILEQAHEGVFVEHDCPAMYACAAIVAEFGEEHVKAHEQREEAQWPCPECGGDKSRHHRAWICPTANQE
jgi:hypothetical protein